MSLLSSKNGFMEKSYAVMGRNIRPRYRSSLEANETRPNPNDYYYSLTYNFRSCQSIEVPTEASQVPSLPDSLILALHLLEAVVHHLAIGKLLQQSSVLESLCRGWTKITMPFNEFAAFLTS